MSRTPPMLADHILELSHATKIEEAWREWRFRYIYISWGHCPCSQRIKEHCVIRNLATGAETFVGNVCVKRCTGQDHGHLFNDFKRLSGPQPKAPSPEFIEMAHQVGVLNDWEQRFMTDMFNRGKLPRSEKQERWFLSIAAKLSTSPTLISPEAVVERENKSKKVLA